MTLHFNPGYSNSITPREARSKGKDGTPCRPGPRGRISIEKGYLTCYYKDIKGIYVSPMPRITLFAKGNSDLRDCLLYLRQGEKVLWNGINTLVREQHSGFNIRVQHEPWTRSDALLATNGVSPASLEQAGLPHYNHPLKYQFSNALFETRADLYLLSIIPDLLNTLARHREDGHMFMPIATGDYSPAQREWLARNYEPLPLLSVDAALANFETIIARLRERTDAPVLVFNCSACLSGNSLFSYLGMKDTLSTRIREFNLGLVRLSQRTGIAIVDIDQLFARHGASRMSNDPAHMTAEGCQIACAEVVRIMEAYGLFAYDEQSA